MASNKSKRHTHKYHRVTLTIGRVWACALPDCSHHMPQVYDALVEGKASFCWKCGETMILNNHNMKQDKPLCDDCGITTDLSSMLTERGI